MSERPVHDDRIERARTLRAALLEQRQIYLELEEHTRRQGEILLGGRTEEILALARAKESILERVERIETSIAPLKERWRSDRESLPAVVRDEVESALDGLHDTLAALISLEGEQQRSVESARLETAEELRKIDGGRRVHQAYSAPNAAAPPRYLDRTE